MLQKTTVTILALGALLMGSFALAQTDSTSSPQANTPPIIKPLPVVFPIAELGGCTSKEACKAYCEDVTHRDACYAYAQTHGLMRADEVARARAFIKESYLNERGASSSVEAILAAKGGPGGCTTRDACKTFCDDPANSNVCLLFAKEHKLMTTEQIGLAKKLAGQVGPGGCKGEGCKTYCQNSEHQQVCIEFARQNGFISEDDATQRLEHMQLSSTTRPLPPLNAKERERTGSTTSPGRLPPKPNTASTTRPGVFNGNQRPPQPAGSSSTQNIDYSKPPYHCTPAQAAEGACESPSTASEQGGSLFFAILHFFGI